MATLDEQLQTLRRLGIELKPGVNLDDLLDHATYAEYEDDPYSYLIFELSEGGDYSSDIRAIPLKVVDRPGVYVFLAHIISELADGALPLEDVQDYVNPVTGLGWLLFTLGKRRYRWEVAVNGRALDLNIICRFGALLADQGTDKRLIQSVDDEMCTLTCMTPSQYSEFNRLLPEWDWVMLT